MRFSFPRQNTKRRLCVADFYRGKTTGEYDVLGLQLVTVGDRSAEASQELFKANRYQDYLYLHGFGVECAEALAELWHKRMRQELGFGCEDSPKIPQLFQQGYRGSRFSLGYGACPSLEDRAKVMELLKPESDRRDAERELHARAGAEHGRAGGPPPAGEVLRHVIQMSRQVALMNRLLYTVAAVAATVTAACYVGAICSQPPFSLISSPAEWAPPPRPASWPIRPPSIALTF